MLNKKSKKSTFLSTQKSALLKKVLCWATMLKKYFFEYSKKYFPQKCTQKVLYWALWLKKVLFLSTQKSTFAQKSTFLSAQKSTLINKVLKKGLKKGIFLKKILLLKKSTSSQKCNFWSTKYFFSSKKYLY